MRPPVRVTLIGIGATLLALLPAVADAPLADRPAGATAPTPPVIRIEHERVAATVIEGSPPDEPRTAQRTPIERGRPLGRLHTGQNGFMSRARQFIVGDGRYRPEPFPRARE